MTINFFSALLGSLGACLFGSNLWMFLRLLAPKAGQKVSQSTITVVCLIGSLCFAFSKSYWSVSLAAKGGIYNLQVVLELSLLLLFQQLIYNTPAAKGAGYSKGLYLLIFIFALGLVNHWPSLMLLIPAIVLLAFIYQSFKLSKSSFHFSPKQILFVLTILCVVLSLYLYLPLRSNLHPALNFGDPSSFQRFSDSLSRADYFKRETLASFIPTALSTIGGKAVYISERFWTEFPTIFSVFAFLGLFLLWRRGLKNEMLFLLVVLLTTLVANLLYLQVAPIEYWHMDDHLLTVNWVTGFLASLGLYHATTWAASRGLLKYAFWIFLILLPFLTWQKSLTFDNQTREFLYQGYGMEALKSMDANARYFAESDYDYFSILYLKEVERKRPDVDLKMTTFLDKNDWDNLVKEVSSRTSPAGHSIYCAFPNGDFVNGYLNHSQTAAFEPFGLETQFMPIKISDEKESLKLLREFLRRYILPNLKNRNPINKLLLELCAHPYLNMADYLKLRHNFDHWGELYTYGICLISDPGWRAQEEEKAAEGWLLSGNSKINKKTALTYYMVSGDDYWFSGQKTKAKKMFEKAINIDPTDEIVPYIQRDLTDLNNSK